MLDEVVFEDDDFDDEEDFELLCELDFLLDELLIVEADEMLDDDDAKLEKLESAVPSDEENSKIVDEESKPLAIAGFDNGEVQAVPKNNIMIACATSINLHTEPFIIEPLMSIAFLFLTSIKRIFMLKLYPMLKCHYLWRMYWLRKCLMMM